MTMKTIKITENTGDFLKDELKKGCLLLHEKYLDKLPDSWFDAFTFIFMNGVDQRKNDSVCILGEEESEKFFEASAKDEITLYVLSDKKSNGKKIVWNLLLTKHRTKDDEETKILFVGGENLRQFCDEKNIYYESFLTDKNLLMSATTMMFEKPDNVDCRVPKNKG